MRPGPSDPWLKRAELFLRRQVVRTLGVIFHRRRPVPSPQDLKSARVLLIRQDRIGDVLVSTPLIDALHQSRPELTIDMLVSVNNVAALDGIPSVRQGWVYHRTLASMVRIVRQIRRERYDVAIDLMDNPSATSTAFSLLSGARWTIGLAKDNDFSYDIRVPLQSRKERHIIERLAPLAEPFGVPAALAEKAVVYEPRPAARSQAREHYRSLGCLERTKIGINISAGHERRYWGTDRFREFLRILRAKHPESAIIIGSKPSDASRAHEIAAGMPDVFVLPAQSSFDSFAAAVAHLDILLTPDTSVVHLASAFSIPSVVLFIQSNPELRVWEPFRSPHISVVTGSDDIRTITLEHVADAWTRLSASVGPISVARSVVGGRGL